jgi:hypothetical protein
VPTFTYVGDEPRYYPSLSLSVKPGDVVTLDTDPGDGRFKPKGSNAAAPSADTPEGGK